MTRKKALLRFFWSISLLAGSPASARTPAESAPAGPTTQAPLVLGTGPVPGSNGGPESRMQMGGAGPTIRNVRIATLTPVLPPAGKATGLAVVVAPGGAFRFLSIDDEGFAVARWLAGQGIAAFVLKYRTVPTPGDDRAAVAGVMALLARPIARDGTNLPLATPPYALEDSTAALRLVRAKAAGWHVDPRRVGMVGFSAGAMTILDTALKAPPDLRPAFIAPIYPPMGRVAVPKDAPPMFVAIAANDPLFGGMDYGLTESWRDAGRPVELHVYQTGGHGFGLGRPGTTTTEWPASLLRWLAANGLMTPSR